MSSISWSWNRSTFAPESSFGKPLVTLENTCPFKRSSDSSRQAAPLQKAHNNDVTTSTPLSGARPSPLLLIDDDRSLATLISEYCDGGGFSVTSALNGEEGLRLIRQQKFALIILDVMLPGISGFEVLERLRRVTDTPILMLTTRSMFRESLPTICTHGVLSANNVLGENAARDESKSSVLSLDAFIFANEAGGFLTLTTFATGCCTKLLATCSCPN